MPVTPTCCAKRSTAALVRTACLTSGSAYGNHLRITPAAALAFEERVHPGRLKKDVFAHSLHRLTRGRLHAFFPPTGLCAARSVVVAFTRGRSVLPTAVRGDRL